MITNRTISPPFLHRHPRYCMDGDEPWQVPVWGEPSQALLPQTFHSLQNDTVLHSSALNSVTHQCWENINNQLVMKSQTSSIIISSYKRQFCPAEVSGPLFLCLARFQNYWRTTSHSPDSLFNFTLFFKGLKLPYFDPSHFKPSVFNWQFLAFPTSVSNTFTNWCIVW